MSSSFEGNYTGDDALFREIRAGFERGPDTRAAWAERLPPTSMSDVARSLLASTDPVTALSALGVLAGQYCFGANCAVGSSVARAGYEIGKELLGPARPGLLPMTVTLAAAHYTTACASLGRWNDILAFYRAEIDFLEALEDQNVSTVRVGKLAALVGLQRLDDAKNFIKKNSYRIEGAAAIEFTRLSNMVDQMVLPVAKPAQPAPSSVATTSAAALVQLASTLIDLGSTGPVKDSTEMNEWTAKRLIRQASGIFLGNPEETALKKALADLTDLRNFTQTAGPREDHHDLLWTTYLCQSRLKSFSEAGDSLRVLADEIEKYRRSIADPMSRAGVSSRYPHLYPALCNMLFRAERAPDLLDAMEAAKGRAVADILEKKGNVIPGHGTLPSAFLPELAKANSTHYLSFFVDEEETYAVLVDKRGGLHICPPLKLGKDRIRAAAESADPFLWNKPFGGDVFEPPVEPVARTLAPLVAWLDPLLTRRILEPNDHICYCPDEHLHHIPLHYLSFRDKPLVNTFSVSRIHGAAVLARILRQAPSVPTSYVAVEVPVRSDEDNAQIMKTFGWASTWLSSRMSGSCMKGVRATVDALSETPLTAQLIHFSTHGTFPAATATAGAFNASGLLLADSNGLPSNERPDLQLRKTLTPARILERELDFTGSVITTQACLSGLSTEGIGGDALGLDWAFLQAGAVTLLSTHWAISARLATAFLQGFYEKWLEQGQPRAAAWRNTCLEFLKDRELSDPYAWAGFSLCGDWR